jgi:Domain of Unknown Function (DUF748)
MGGMFRSVGTRTVHFARRRWRWIVAIMALPVVLLVATDVLLDEPIRRQVEQRMNERLKGYKVTLQGADFHVWGFSLDLLNLVVVQEANPDPPIARIPKLSASVQWRELIWGKVVADFRFLRPVVHFNLAHFRAEQKDPRPVKEKGWQEALESIYPVKINEFRIVEGDVTYEDRGPFKPLHVTRVNFKADNIRNIRSRTHSYPSPIHLDAVVFDTGSLVADGHADFLGVPHPGAKANLKVQGIPLDYLKPITERYNLAVRKGTLSIDGTVEYASDGGTLAVVRELVADSLDLDWVHTAQTKAAEEQTTQKAKETAQEVSNKPEMLLRVEHARIQKSTFGFVNAAAKPTYRVFISDTQADIKNLSNHSTEGTATATLRGKFMGSGATVLSANFRPEKNGPDFDLAVRVENTDMRAMNDLLRAYGKFDVVSGLFSLYAELAVKNGQVQGYIKPLFRDLKAYDKRQDKEKSAFRKLYEKLVGGVSKLVENEPRSEVATKAEIKGRLDNPKASTWEVLVNLIRNAFFKAILPGFDEELTRLARG